MLTTKGSGQVSVRRNAGNFANAVQTGIAIAPKVIEAVEQGLNLAKSAGKALGGRRNRGGYRAGGIGKETEAVVEKNLPTGKGANVGSKPGNAQSMNRPDAPTSLAIHFDGPTYKFSACNFQGMSGLCFSSTQIIASVEQNTTTTLRGILRTLSLAGVAGDTSMIASSITPCGSYLASTSLGRISLANTPLYSIGAPFRKYRLKRLIVKYEAELATTATGGIALAFTQDAVDTVLTSSLTAVAAAQYTTSCMTTVWDDAILDCTPSLDKSLKNTNPDGTTPTILSYGLATPGSLIVIADQTFAANSVLGKLIAFMEWEFYGIGPLPSSFAIQMAREAVRYEFDAKQRMRAYQESDEKQKEMDEKKEESYEQLFVEEAFPKPGPIVVPPPEATPKQAIPVVKKGYLSF